MSSKTTSKLESRTPHYLKHTCASLGQRVGNRTQSPSRSRRDQFRSFSRCHSTTFSSAFDQSKTRSTSVQPHYMKGTKSSKAMQRKSAPKRDTMKLRAYLKTRGTSVKKTVGVNAGSSEMTRVQSDAPSTADSALSVPSLKRSRARKKEKPITQLETCYSLDLTDYADPGRTSQSSDFDKKKFQKEPMNCAKTSGISQSIFIQVISRLEQHNKIVVDLYDIAILVHKRNEATKSKKHKDSKKENKIAQVPESGVKKLKSMLEYSKGVGNWAWTEVSGSRSLRAVAAWAVLNLTIHLPSWLCPTPSSYTTFGGLGIFANPGMDSITSHVGMKSAASISMDLLRSAVVLLAAI